MLVQKLQYPNQILDKLRKKIALCLKNNIKNSNKSISQTKLIAVFYKDRSKIQR